jgi:hypothetical protein
MRILKGARPRPERFNSQIRVIGAPANFHFLGICSTAMGSVAAASVTGEDRGCDTFCRRRRLPRRRR